MKFLLPLFFCWHIYAANLISVTFSKTGVPVGKFKLTLTWDNPPDFNTIDEYHRQADSFQFYVYPYYSNAPVGQVTWSDIQWSAIIRGCEIHSTNAVVVRSKSPYIHPPFLRLQNDPNTNAWFYVASGGWGTNRGIYGYTITNKIVTVVLDSSTLGITGPFSIIRGYYNYGIGRGEVSQLINLSP